MPTKLKIIEVIDADCETKITGLEIIGTAEVTDCQMEIDLEVVEITGQREISGTADYQMKIQG
jgi:hypothetical protein